MKRNHRKKEQILIRIVIKMSRGMFGMTNNLTLYKNKCTDIRCCIFIRCLTDIDTMIGFLNLFQGEILDRYIDFH